MPTTTTTPDSTRLLSALVSVELDIRAALEEGASVDPIGDSLGDASALILACPEAHRAQLDTLLALVETMVFCVTSGAVRTTREGDRAYLHSASLIAGRARALVALARFDR